jgi:hypothetical protein
MKKIITLILLFISATGYSQVHRYATVQYDSNKVITPYAFSTALATKVDSITKSGDSLYYWKLGAKAFVTVLSSGWSLTGNSINPATDFIGTTSNHALNFKANNLNSGTISASSTTFGYNINTGTSNALFGTEVLKIASSPLQNSLFGYRIGINSTSMNYTTAMGYAALALSTTANSDVAIGWGALAKNRHGYLNVGVGVAVNNWNLTPIGDTLIGNTWVGSYSAERQRTGRYNAFFGYNAGRYSTSASRSVFLGPFAGENENGDDLLYIANSSTTTPLIKGNFAASTLDINGTLKVTGGSPAVGKVFTSIDANGTGSWETPATGVTVTSYSKNATRDSTILLLSNGTRYAAKDSVGGGNIYTADGTLTGARTITSGGFPLTIAGTQPNTFHANGNITFGPTTSGGVPFSDSSYKMSIVADNNFLRLKRNRAGGDVMQMNYDLASERTSLYSGAGLIIACANQLAIGGTGRLVLGANQTDGLTPVTIGYESWRGSESSAMLDIRTTARGFLMPRMDSTQRNAIATPATGLQIYNTNTNAFNYYNGTAWTAIGGGTGGGVTITSYGKNAGRDSTILLLSNGTRFAAKDSVGSGGGSGSIDYTTEGYGIKVDSSGRVYTVRVDSTVIGSKTYINKVVSDSMAQLTIGVGLELTNDTLLSLKQVTVDEIGGVSNEQTTIWDNSEPDLGVPSVNGYVLSSTTAGDRSWVDYVNPTGTQTLTNKRITQRVNTIASSGTPTPTSDNSDMFTVTALAANATFAAPTGTPTDGQSLLLRIKDNGTARTLGWNAIYRAGTDFALPTTTVISKTIYLQLIYNAADTKWDAVGLSQGY